MDDELCTAMLTAVFAAVIALLGLIFVYQRKREEAALLLRRIAVSQARAVPSYSRPEGFPKRRTRAHTPFSGASELTPTMSDRHPGVRICSGRPHLIRSSFCTASETETPPGD